MSLHLIRDGGLVQTKVEVCSGLTLSGTLSSCEGMELVFGPSLDQEFIIEWVNIS